MHSLEEARSWIEARVDDVYGSRVGKLIDIYFDPSDQEVHWLLVRTGLTSDGELKLVPVQYSIASHGKVWVPITKDLIARAPAVPPGRGLTRAEEVELCFHYGGLRGRSVQLRERESAAATAVPATAVVPFRPKS